MRGWCYFISRDIILPKEAVILNTTLWQILTLLFQGTVAGIIVLFVTRKLQERKDREL